MAFGKNNNFYSAFWLLISNEKKIKKTSTKQEMTTQLGCPDTAPEQNVFQYDYMRHAHGATEQQLQVG